MHNKIVLENKSISKSELTDLIVDCIQDIKGQNIIKMDLRELDDAPTDYEATVFACYNSNPKTHHWVVIDDPRVTIQNQH